MTPEALAIIERLFKALIFVPTIGLVGWWIFTNWLDRTLSLEETVIASLLLGAAFALGVVSIIAGGWGFLGVIAIVYLALVALLVWEYIYWRRREREHHLSEIARYQQAVEQDPTNAAAYSFLGENLLRLRRFEDAQEAVEKALQLDPESKRDRRLLRLAKERRPQYPWRRTD
jgi:tetratricopeptide (TPR) repeat protein